MANDEDLHKGGVGPGVGPGSKQPWQRSRFKVRLPRVQGARNMLENAFERAL
jgi:hypothetical protein